MRANLSGPAPGSAYGPAIGKRVVQVLSIAVLEALLLFLPAGRIGWVAGWAYIFQYVAVIAVVAVWAVRGRPDLVTERAQPKGGKRWDVVLSGFLSASAFLMLPVSGLDVRLGWSRPFGWPLQTAGFVLTALGFLLFAWAMASNRFFSWRPAAPTASRATRGTSELWCIPWQRRYCWGRCGPSCLPLSPWG